MKSSILVGFMIVASICFAAESGENETKTEQKLSARLDKLRHTLFELEETGRKNTPAHQILSEAEWLHSSTRNFERLATRLDALRMAIDEPANLVANDEQSPEDGAWGRWYTEWFFKLTASYAQLSELAARGDRPKYALHFLDCINTPEKFTAHLEKLLISNPKIDGYKHRRELNETLSVLVRMIIRDRQHNYDFHPQLRQALYEFLAKARNPQTGYWCDWYGEPTDPRRVIISAQPSTS